MKHLDLFSGIGGFTLAATRCWQKDYENIGHSEIDDEACWFYHKHFPIGQCLGDVNEIKEIKADLITGGFPCQDLSFAGKREGLKGSKSNLFWGMAKVIERNTPAWFIIENVPGFYSSIEGKDFWLAIATLENFGYCVSWKLLDAQYFGVAQRRKRVFIVGSFGNPGSAKVLFVEESGSWNDKKIGEIRERGLSLSTRTGQRQDPTAETYVANVVQANDYRKVQHGQFGNEGNLVAQTIGSTPRGNASFVWQDTHIAETDPIRKRKTHGIPRGMDTQRGRLLGNAIVPEVAYQIMKNIKKQMSQDRR